jgi:MFS family permease
VALATLINRAGTMVLPFLALYLTKSGGFSAVDAGLVLSAYGLGAFITAPLSGKLADRFGNMPVMRGSLLLSCALLLIFPFFHSYPVIVVATFIYAMFNESFRPASMSAMSAVADQADRKQAFVLMRLAINLGMSIGPALGGVLAVFSFRWIFLVDATTAAFAALVLSGWFFKSPATSAVQINTPSEKTATRSLSAYRNWQMLYFALAMLFIAIILFQYDSTMPLYVVNELGLQPYHYGLLVTINTVCILLFEVSLNQLTSHWPHRKSLALSALLWGTGFGALIFARSFWSIAIAVIIWTVGEMIGSPASSAYVADIAPEDRRGEYMGLYTMTYGLGYIIAPWMGTQIMHRWGSNHLWITVFFIGIISAIMVSQIRTRKVF